MALQRLATIHPKYAEEVTTALNQPLATISVTGMPVTPAVVSLIARQIPDGHRPSVVQSSVDSDLQGAVEGELDTLIRDIERGRHGPYTLDPENRVVGGAIVMDAPTGKIRAYTCGRAFGLSVQWDPCSTGRVSLNSVSKVFLLLAALDLGIVQIGDTLDDVKGRAQVAGVSPYLDRICAASGPRSRWPLERLIAASDNCLAVALHRLLPPRAFAQLREIGIEIVPTEPATALGTGTVSVLHLTRLIAGLANGGPIPTWEILEEGHSEEVVAAPVRLPFRTTTLTTGRQILTNVLRQGTAASAGRMLPATLPAFAKTGTADDNQELLIVGAAGSLVATLWLGHQNARRPINETATAGAVLGPHWGRILAIALENAKRATEPIAADAPAHSLVANTPAR